MSSIRSWFSGLQIPKDSQSFRNICMVVTKLSWNLLKITKAKFPHRLFLRLLQWRKGVLLLMARLKTLSCRECKKSGLEFMLETILKLAKPSLRLLLWISWLAQVSSRSRLCPTIIWVTMMARTCRRKSSSSQSRHQSPNALLIFCKIRDFSTPKAKCHPSARTTQSS